MAVEAMLIALGLSAIVHRRRRSDALPGHARPFAVGVVHGLAGSGAMALFVLASTRSPWIGLAAVGLFGLGSIGGMVAVSGVLALPFARLAGGRMEPWALVLVGATSIAFGIYYGFEAA